MKFEVKYLFPTSSSGAYFYIYEIPEGLGMKKIWAHGTTDAKESINQGGHFPVSHGFSMSCAGPKSNLHPRINSGSILTF